MPSVDNAEAALIIAMLNTAFTFHNYALRRHVCIRPNHADTRHYPVLLTHCAGL